MRIYPDTDIPRTNPNPPDPLLQSEYPRESAWQRQVERDFKQLGWRTQHFWDTMRSRPGFPDLVAWCPRTGRTIWAELKTETGKVVPSQVDTLLELSMGNEVWLWRPSDWPEIDLVLSGET